VTATSPDFPSALAGRYQIERELGRGGMATVYLAKDLQQNTVVALKVLRPELSGVVGAERFAREIAIAGRLQHPHILPIHDSGALTGAGGMPVLFYTMPYVAGRSLRGRVNEGQLPIEEAVAIARQVAEALEHAHRQGVVHRDIKPENILLADDSSPERDVMGGTRALVADFGIARAADAAGERLTQTGLALGTPAYMSPEQATGSTRLDGRADIYALGCVLYEMLAGEPPFTGPTAQAVLARHAMDRVPSLRTLRPEVSAGLSRVVRRALAKIPADRYPTARDFADALAAPDNERTDETAASGPTSRASIVRRRLLLAGAVLAVLLAGVLTLMTRVKSAPPVAVDPAVVAVAPFRISSTDPTLAYLREGMVDLLATKLDGTVAIRPVDSRTLLNTWRESKSGALALAGRLGAGQVIEGEVAGKRPRVTLSATLRQVPGGREVGQMRVEGPADSITPLIDQLAARLLARAAGEPEERLPALAATPPPALRAYLDGWSLMRRNHMPDALKSFQTALATDSSFALAALGAARAIFDASLVRDAPEVKLAWRLRDRLTAGDQAYLTAILGPRYPEASDTRERRAAVERLTQVSPGNADGWILHGIFICDGDRGAPDMATRCRAAYQRALALDSLNTIVVGSAKEWDELLDDTAGLRRDLRLFVRLDSVSPASIYLQWSVATTLGDTTMAHRLALSDSMVSTSAEGLGPIYQIAAYFLREGRGFADVDAALRRSIAIGATESLRRSVENAQYGLAIMRGRDTGQPAPQWWSFAWSNYVRVVNAVFAGADPASAAVAADSLERLVGSPVTGGCCLERFAAAEWALRASRLATVRRALSDMERYPRSPEGRARSPGEFRVWPLIVAAQLASAEGSPAAAELLSRLDSARVDRDDDSGLTWLYGNLIAARLHEERGEYPAALAAIRGRDGYWFDPAVVTYHREEGRIAAAARDTAGAIRAYQRYLRIRADAEPRLQPEVQQVRAALAALRRSR
jgi:TolB-like protein